MTFEQMKNLKQGDIVCGKSSGNYYIVTANFGDRLTAVQTADITNPAEWDVIYTCKEIQEK